MLRDTYLSAMFMCTCVANVLTSWCVAISCHEPPECLKYITCRIISPAKHIPLGIIDKIDMKITCMDHWRSVRLQVFAKRAPPVSTVSVFMLVCSCCLTPHSNTSALPRQPITIRVFTRQGKWWLANPVTQCPFLINLLFINDSRECSSYTFFLLIFLASRVQWILNIKFSGSNKRFDCIQSAELTIKIILTQNIPDLTNVIWVSISGHNII